MIERRVAIGNLELAVLEAGAGGRPLLLVHGFTGAKEDFRDEIDRLAARGHHVVAPDHRGHGASDQPPGEDAYGLEHFAADMWTLVDGLGWERFDVLGHSMGGMIAQLMVLERPERVDRLVLMDTHHGPLSLDPDLVAAGVELARRDGLGAILEVQRMGADPLANPAWVRVCAERPGYEQWCEAKLLACSPAMYAAMAASFGALPERLEGLAAVGCPTLVLVGEHDEPFLAASRRIAGAIRGARLVVLPDGGHSPQFESTDAWREAIDGFLGVAPDAAAGPVMMET